MEEGDEERDEERDEELEEELEEPLEELRTPRGGRVIVHLDLDCFYAQVEMLRNPELKAKPLGVQQKSLVVTCNYEARKFGIGKLMAVRDAKEKCPQIVLVKGEDLTPYREMSYKVTELLGEFCPLVERLGLDENFVDVTELVGKRLQQLEESAHSQIQLCGHVYNQQGINWQDPRHIQLILGSQVAQEFRDSLKTRLGLTGCAGVASNKLLAKLVSGTFKPDQQTLLLPENHRDLLSSLEHVRKVPGIGHKTSQRLELLGVRNVWELQDFPAALLEKEFGFARAQKLRKLSFGEDDSPVTPSGPPQSFSDEDSFPKCSSPAEVKEKLQDLLPNLLARISKDGRQPHTVRLSIRRFSPWEHWSHRESRQCPIPSHLIPKFGKGSSSLVSPLIEILLKLLGKMIPLELPFHLTLLNVCFSNLKAIPGGKNSIGFYLKREAPLSSGKPGGVSWKNLGRGAGRQGILGYPSWASRISWNVSLPQEGEVGKGEGSSSWNADRARKTRRLPEESGGKEAFLGPSSLEGLGMTSQEKQAGIGAPPGVDPEVFQELPPELQQELAAHWKNQEVGRQNSMENAPKSPQGKRRRRKNLGSLSQSNSLLRYLKPR